jgi:hypothetical protein
MHIRCSCSTNLTPTPLPSLAAALVAANPGLAKLLFALVFPVGLTMNTLHGTELFTGNTMKLPAAIYEGKTNMGGLIKNWFWSYSGACMQYSCGLRGLCAVCEMTGLEYSYGEYLVLR